MTAAAPRSQNVNRARSLTYDHRVGITVHVADLAKLRESFKLNLPMVDRLSKSATK